MTHDLRQNSESLIPLGVRQVNPLADAAWDAALAATPNATLFHTAAWARVLQDTYGYAPTYFVLGQTGDGYRSQVASHKSASARPETLDLKPATAGHAPRAVLPLMEVASWMTGRRGLSLPFTDECAALCPDGDSFRNLFGAAVDLARARGWRYLEFRGGKTLFGDAPASTSFWGHRLDLRAGEAALLAGVEGSVRRAIKKAGQSELRIDFSQDLEAIRTFHRLLCVTRKRHGVPPQPFGFFRNIQRHILAQNRGWVVLARHGQEPVAGAVYFHFGATAIYKYGASDERFQHLRANNLVMWEAIKRFANQGFAALDFGRTSLDNEGLRRFKLSWGATEHRLDYVRYDCRAGRFVTSRDESSGWHNRVFRALPIPVSRLIGALLYRHIA